jgi:hypothetical protein
LAALRSSAIVDVDERQLLVVGERSGDKPDDEARVVTEEEVVAELEALQAEAPDPLLVLPLGYAPDDAQQLRATTGDSVWVITGVVNPTNESEILESYRTKIAVDEEPLSASVEGSAQLGYRLSMANLLPGEVAEVTGLSLISPEGDQVPCDLTTFTLPAEIAATGGATLPTAITIRTTVGGQPARTATPVSVSSETAPTSEPEDEPSEESSARDDEPARTSTDEGSGGGVPIWSLVVIAGAAAGIGFFLARNRGPTDAPRHLHPGPAPSGWNGGHPQPHPFAAERPPPPGPGWVAAVRSGSDVRVEDLGIDRLIPSDLDEGRVWHGHLGSTAGLALWLEKRPDLGEDAEPTLRLHGSGRGLIGVYDGTGGSGAGVARRTRNGLELSGAYVASRLAREVTETWFTQVVEGGTPKIEGHDLAERLAKAFDDEALNLGAAGPVKGSLHRRLPTTLAAMAFETSADDTGVVDVLWAGDSRAYVLTPEQGLQVLSVDDTRETDALELIRNDQPMTNLVSADRSFIIHHARHLVAGPALLLTATDGCFGYVRTPAHFEYLVLRTLLESPDLGSWSARLLRSIHGFTADDASLSLVSFGFSTIAAMKASLGPRCEYLHHEHWAPFSSATEAEAEGLPEHSWHAYRELYHARVDTAEAVR